MQVVGFSDDVKDIVREYETLNRKYQNMPVHDVQRLYDPSNDPMKICSFTSNGWKITEKMIALQKDLEKAYGQSPFEVVSLFSDSDGSATNLNPFFEVYKVEEAKKKFGLPVHVIDINKFYQEFGYASKNDSRLSKEEKSRIRKAYDSEVLSKIGDFDCIVLDYYWSLCSEVIVDNHLVINSHLGDLSLVDENGKKILKGYYPVRNAIKNGHTTLKSSTHLVNNSVDDGLLLAISSGIRIDPLEDFRRLIRYKTLNQIEELLQNEVELNYLEDYYESRMRNECDCTILPLTAWLASEGRLARKDNRLYFNGNKMDDSIRI